MENIKIFTVKEVNVYIKQLIEKDLLLSFIYVKGEISNFVIHTSGHMYFTLKDKESRVNCVMFRTNVEKLKFKPEEGMQIIVKGYFSIYERNGNYQLYAQSIILDGTGELYKAFEQLKNKLQNEGLFEDRIKKTIPSYPKNVAVITSPTGAAVRDIISIGKRRNSNIKISLYPVLVQGEKAPFEIAEAIEYINKRKDSDVIIMGRGGGSIEELWAFNEEVVARAIYNSIIPIVSAVGHETDFTIADFVSDLRAATPSAAAEIVFPDKKQLFYNLLKINKQMDLLILNLIKSRKAFLNNYINSYSFRNVETNIVNYRQTYESLAVELDNGIKKYLNRKQEYLRLSIEKLKILNPTSYLKRGYSYIENLDDRKLISSISHTLPDQRIRIFFKDGSVLAKIESRYEGDINE